MLRLQIRLESVEDEQSHWSQSAIGCMTSVLNGVLSFVRRIETEQLDTYCIRSKQFTRALNDVVGASIIFFKMIRLFLAQESSSSSKAPTLGALVSEQITLFQSCCQRILAYQSPIAVSDPPCLLRFSDDLRNDVRELSNEIYKDFKN